MGKNITICVGTVGSGIWRSPDGGESWNRIGNGIWGQNDVLSLAVHPNDPSTLFAGTDDGIYKSANRGESFEKLGFPDNRMKVRRLAIDPSNPDTMFAGTLPSALFRSRDAGQSWQQLSVDLATECPAVRIPRVTGLVVDPTNSNNIWAGIEVDGARRSLDGGETWTYVEGGLSDPDIHDVTVSPGDPTTVVVSTPREIFTSTDTGESWQALGVLSQFSQGYCRMIALKENDPKTMFVAVGNGAVGDNGTMYRTKDLGQSWEEMSLPVEPNAPIWTFATHAADPDLVLACSHYGEVYATADGGDWWVKLRREFTEIWGMAWMPN